MSCFVPREKLSKKAKREQDNARRNTWGSTNPVTRRIENKKAYNRKKPSCWTDDSSTRVFSLSA